SVRFCGSAAAAGAECTGAGSRRPQQNAKVERSHRIDQEEFWSRHRFPDFEAAAAALRDWETTYNHQRFSLAGHGRTPAKTLALFQPSSRVAQVPHVYARPIPKTGGQS